MTKGNREDPKTGSRMERFQQGVQKHTLLAKKKMQSITKDDVKSYLLRNAFVLFTIVAVILALDDQQQTSDRSSTTTYSNGRVPVRLEHKLEN
uniref:Uncharacterized protein n=1 Tax=Falco tinnunculus TaxID=100819 RepID=A0A8C4U097_FALTI